MVGRCYWTAVFVMVLHIYFQTGDLFVHSVADPPPGADTVCNTPECNTTAAAMMAKMNVSAHPCENFNEFACGRFIEDIVIPDGKQLISTLNILDDTIKVDLRDMLLSGNNSTEQGYLSKMRQFYRSCYNEDQVEAMGLTPYFSDHTFTADWPTLNPHWSQIGFHLNDLIARYSSVYIDPIIGITVSIDVANISKYAVYLRTGALGMELKHYSLPRNSSIIQAYETYLIETAVALNASRPVAVLDARGVVDLEIELSKIMLSGVNPQFVILKLGQLSKLYPRLDIARVIRTEFNTVSISLTDEERIITSVPTYIKDIESVLECFSNRTIQNLYGFKFAVSRVGSLTQRLRRIRRDFDTALASGDVRERWLDCIYSTSTVFWKGLSKHFVNSRFSERAKCKVNQMIDNIKKEMKKMIEDVTWMNESTKHEASMKLAAIKRKVGYPDVGFQEEDIERIFENLRIIEGNYYSNRIHGNNLVRKGELASLRKPVNRDKWDNPPHDFNLHYVTDTNELVLHAAFMQAPLFKETFQDYKNYGALGTVIGHELTHGFDLQGIIFDARGIQRNWWTQEDAMNFLNRALCIIDQFSNYHIIDGGSLTVDGIFTHSETEADLAGLKQAFRAYKQRVLTHGQQPRLPDLNLTQDQLFFLSFAQVYCEKATIAGLIGQWSSDFPPGKYRIIGTLQNSEDFARAYNCPRGSYMNPERKCGMW